MKLLSVEACVTLLCGVSVLFAMDSKSTSIPETSSSSSSSNSTTTEANKLLTTGHKLHNATEMQMHVSWNQSPTHKPAQVSVTATADTTVSHTLETEDGPMRNQSDRSNGSTSGLVITATTTSSGPGLLPTLTAAGTVHPSLTNTMTSETNRPTERETSSASADVPAPAASTATGAASLLTSTTQSKLLSTTSADDSTSHLRSSTSASTVATLTTSSTSEETPVFDPTSVTRTWTSTTGPKLSSTPQHISDTGTHISTSHFPNTATSVPVTESPTTTVSESFSTSTSAVSTSPVGNLVPLVPKKLPIPSSPATKTRTTTTTSTTTTPPCGVSKNQPSSEVVQPCSTRGVVKQCLITIACLAVLATIFMVSTIVLCTKLSTRKYKVNKPQQSTEMMCISALLPERNYSYTRQRSPVTNGVLVIPYGEDSEEEGGDNLTLSSFLPENDRYV